MPALLSLVPVSLLLFSYVMTILNGKQIKLFFQSSFFQFGHSSFDTH